MSFLQKRKFGYFSAGLVAFFQGFEGIIYTFLAYVFGMFVIQNSSFAAITMAGKELFSLIFSIFIFGPVLFWHVIKKIRSKKGLYFSVAAIFGTSTGNIFYILAVAKAGSSYGVILTALYPIFSMLLVKFFMKEKESYLVWVGVFITCFFGFLFLILPTILQKGISKEVFWKRIIGMLFGLLAAFFWAFESFFIKMGMNLKKSKYEFNNNEIIMTRNIFSTLTTWIVILPVIWMCSKFGFANNGNSNFLHFFNIFTNWKSILIIVSISINIIFLRFLHIKAIQLIGPKLTAIIDTNNFLVPPLFAEFLRFLPKTPYKINDHYQRMVPIFENIIWWSYFLIIPIILGVAMVIYYHKPKNIEVLDPN